MFNAWSGIKIINVEMVLHIGQVPMLVVQQKYAHLETRTVPVVETAGGGPGWP